MKKLYYAGVAAMLALAGSGVARADVSSIDLVSALFPVEFTGNGNNIEVNFGNCMGSSCDLNGAGVAIGGTSPVTSTWDLGTTANSVDLTYSNGAWAFNAAAPITFYFGLGGSLLSGQMNLNAMGSQPFNGVTTQYGVAGSMQANGGMYQSNFGPGLASVGMKFIFLGSVDLTSLLGTANMGRQMSATLMVGQINAPTPAPEGASVWLTGGGLMLLGTILRLRRGQGRQQRG